MISLLWFWLVYISAMASINYLTRDDLKEELNPIKQAINKLQEQMDILLKIARTTIHPQGQHQSTV